MSKTPNNIMNKETLEAIDKEIKEILSDIPSHDYGLLPVEETRKALLQATQSKAARNYWIRWAWNKLNPRTSDDGFDITLTDLIALADKEQDEK